jgi:hypothetical protein
MSEWGLGELERRPCGAADKAVSQRSANSQCKRACQSVSNSGKGQLCDSENR